jgi:hypothetical protein
VVKLVRVSLAVNVASSAVPDLLWRLVSGIRHDHDSPTGLGWPRRGLAAVTW